MQRYISCEDMLEYKVWGFTPSSCHMAARLVFFSALRNYCYYEDTQLQESDGDLKTANNNKKKKKSCRI